MPHVSPFVPLSPAILQHFAALLDLFKCRGGSAAELFVETWRIRYCRGAFGNRLPA